MEIQKDMKRYEAMAKLGFDDKESAWALSAFEYILSSFEKLDGISTDGVPPLIYISDTQNILREDDVISSDLGEIFLKSVPDTENGYILVPKAIE